MSEKTEYVEVMVRLPKPVVDFLRRFMDLVGDDFNGFVESAVVHEINSIMVTEEIFDTPWTCTMNVIERNKLRPFIDESYIKSAKNNC